MKPASPRLLLVVVLIDEGCWSTCKLPHGALLRHRRRFSNLQHSHTIFGLVKSFSWPCSEDESCATPFAIR